MIDLILFYVWAGLSGLAADRRRWGWCVVFVLFAIKAALKVT